MLLMLAAYMKLKCHVYSLAVKQAQPKMCHSLKVEDGVKNNCFIS